VRPAALSNPSSEAAPDDSTLPNQALTAYGNLEDGKNVPQRLKPGTAVSLYGTTEAVPLLKTEFSRWL
jgi:hypothetical protein